MWQNWESGGGVISIKSAIVTLLSRIVHGTLSSFQRSGSPLYHVLGHTLYVYVSVRWNRTGEDHRSRAEVSTDTCSWKRNIRGGVCHPEWCRGHWEPSSRIKVPWKLWKVGQRDPTMGHIEGEILISLKSVEVKPRFHARHQKEYSKWTDRQTSRNGSEDQEAKQLGFST